MVQIKKTEELFFYNAKLNAAERTTSQSSESIMGNKIVDSPDDTVRIETSQQKSQEMRRFEEEINKYNSSNISNELKAYKNRTGKSLVDEINQSSLSQTEKAQLLNKMKGMSKKNTYAANELLANDLLNTLNTNDKAKISQLINEEVTADNVRYVYSKYIRLSKARGETASTPEEKNRSWHSTKNKKVRGKRPESLYQGIINNTSLTLKEKEAFLTNLTDKFAKYAQQKKIPQAQIDAYKADAAKEIKILTTERPPADNAVTLEDNLYYKLTKDF